MAVTGNRLHVVQKLTAAWVVSIFPYFNVDLVFITMFMSQPLELILSSKDLVNILTYRLLTIFLSLSARLRLNFPSRVFLQVFRTKLFTTC